MVPGHARTLACFLARLLLRSGPPARPYPFALAPKEDRVRSAGQGCAGPGLRVRLLIPRDSIYTQKLGRLLSLRVTATPCLTDGGLHCTLVGLAAIFVQSITALSMHRLVWRIRTIMSCHSQPLS
jgi:hypothetical protein